MSLNWRRGHLLAVRPEVPRRELLRGVANRVAAEQLIPLRPLFSWVANKDLIEVELRIYLNLRTYN